MSNSEITAANVHVLHHPLVRSKLTTLRLHDLAPKDFREGIRSIGSMVLYEAARSLPLETAPNLQSPIATFEGEFIAPRIGLVPILRAGIGMTDAALDMFPDAAVLHLGLFREKTTLQVIEYYSKLPTNVTVDVVYLLDPLIATANTCIAALANLEEWGMDMSKVKVISVLGSKQGVERVARERPEVEIWIAGVDEELTEEGYVKPGLGDAGDRYFNTPHSKDV